MTKPIIAVNIMQYVERGVLSLDDEITKYLPQFNNLFVSEKLISPEDADETGLKVKDEVLRSIKLVPAERNIKILDLLNHTSGMGQGLLGSGFILDHCSAEDTLSDRLNIYSEAPCDFQPGTGTGYSAMAGFDILGAILEIVSGKDLESCLVENILKPLGIKDIAFLLNHEQEDRLSRLYEYSNGNLIDTTDTDFLWNLFRSIPGKRYSACAGLYGTLETYDRFARMLLGRGEIDGVRLLEEKTVQLMSTPSTKHEKDPGCRWGLGMLIWGDRINTGRYLEEGTFGWSGAFGTHFYIDPKNNMTVVIMLNRSNIDGEWSYISKEISDIVYQTYVEKN